MRRVVLDANVLISGIVTTGICRSIVGSLEDDTFAAAISPALLEELLRALEKPKLKKLVSPALQEKMISLIHMKAIIVEPMVRIKASRDPDDDAVIECAVAAKASVIVTGDKDLLTMKRYKDIAILSPRSFARQLGLV